MDVSSTLTHSISNLWPFLLLGLLLTFFKSAWFKGLMGEFLVNTLARLFLPKRTYHLVKNVTLPTESGSTQIDHIIVSRFGIFVVETKNMKGWIFGSPSQKTWTQKIFKTTHKFQSPLHQNYKHVKTLEDCLDIEASKLFSLVVFVGESAFKTAMPDNVVKGFGYIRYIKSKSEPLLSESEVESILKIIESGRLKPSIKTNREHVKHVKTIVAKKTAPASTNDVCPKCVSAMVRRKAKQGTNAGKTFLGCSRFPQCRGIRQL